MSSNNSKPMILTLANNYKYYYNCVKCLTYNWFICKLACLMQCPNHSTTWNHSKCRILYEIQIFLKRQKKWITNSILSTLKSEFPSNLNPPPFKFASTCLLVCFWTFSSLLQVCFQSASSLLPVHFQSASSLLSVRFQSASSLLAVYFQGAPVGLQLGSNPNKKYFMYLGRRV